MGAVDLESTNERSIVDVAGVLGTSLSVAGHYRYSKAMPPLAMQSDARHLVLVFLMSGLQQYICNGETIILSGGQGVRFLPGTRYGSGVFPEQKGELVWMIIDIEEGQQLKLPGMNSAASEQWLDEVLKGDAARRFVLTSSARQGLKKVLKKPSEIDNSIEISRYSLRCAEVLIDVYDVLKEGIESSTSPAVNKVLHWMDAHLSEEMHSDILVGLSGLSVSRIQARFKEETGLSPADYFMRRRLIEAQNLLRGSQGITDVAMDMGFSSSQYFSTVFKRYMGLSPSEWLKTSL